MLERFRTIHLLNVILALGFASACVSVCHHGPMHEHTSSSIVSHGGEAPTGQAKEISASCDCGHSHDDGDHDAHLCACVCHVPGVSNMPAQITRISYHFGAPALLDGADALGFRDRVERPPRTS